jgi:hypothetical protein
MHGEQRGRKDRDQRLDTIVTAYLKALEAEQAPDRDQWLARYPELASELGEFFADQDQFDHLTAPLRVIAELAASAKHPLDSPPRSFRTNAAPAFRNVGHTGPLHPMPINQPPVNFAFFQPFREERHFERRR